MSSKINNQKAALEAAKAAAAARKAAVAAVAENPVVSAAGGGASDPNTGAQNPVVDDSLQLAAPFQGVTRVEAVASAAGGDVSVPNTDDVSGILEKLRRVLEEPGNQFPQCTAVSETSEQIYDLIFGTCDASNCVLDAFWSKIGWVSALYCDGRIGLRDLVLFGRDAWELLYKYAARQVTWSVTKGEISIFDAKGKHVDHVPHEFWAALLGGPFGFLFSWLQGGVARDPLGALGLNDFHAVCAVVEGYGSWDSLDIISYYEAGVTVDGSKSATTDGRAADPLSRYYETKMDAARKRVEKIEEARREGKEVKEIKYGPLFDLFKGIFQSDSRGPVPIFRLVAEAYRGHDEGYKRMSETFDILRRMLDSDESSLAGDARIGARSTVLAYLANSESTIDRDLLDRVFGSNPFRTVDRELETRVAIAVRRMFSLDEAYGNVLNEYEKASMALASAIQVLHTARSNEQTRQARIAELEARVRAAEGEIARLKNELERCSNKVAITLDQVNRRYNVDGKATLSPFRVEVPEGLSFGSDAEKQAFLYATYAGHRASFPGWLDDNSFIRGSRLDGRERDLEVVIKKIDGRWVLARECAGASTRPIDLCELAQEVMIGLEMVSQKYGVGGKPVVGIHLGILLKFSDLLKESQLGAGGPRLIDTRGIEAAVRAELKALVARKNELFEAATRAGKGKGAKKALDAARAVKAELDAFGDVNVRIRKACEAAERKLAEVAPEHVREHVERVETSHDYFERLRALFAFLFHTAHSDVLDLDIIVDLIRQHLDPSFGQDLEEGITAHRRLRAGDLEIPGWDREILSAEQLAAIDAEFGKSDDDIILSEAHRLSNVTDRVTMADITAGLTADLVERKANARRRGVQLEHYVAIRAERFALTRPDQMDELKRRVAAFFSVLYEYRYGHEVGRRDSRLSIQSCAWIERLSTADRHVGQRVDELDLAMRAYEGELMLLKEESIKTLEWKLRGAERAFASASERVIGSAASLAAEFRPFEECLEQYGGAYVELVREGRIRDLSLDEMFPALKAMVVRYDNVISQGDSELVRARMIADAYYYRICGESSGASFPEIPLERPVADFEKATEEEECAKMSHLIAAVTVSKSDDVAVAAPTNADRIKRDEQRGKERIDKRMAASAGKTGKVAKPVLPDGLALLNGIVLGSTPAPTPAKAKKVKQTKPVADVEGFVAVSTGKMPFDQM
jgi:hypothetical protein